MRQRHLLLASSFVVAAIVFACSYGNYDGSSGDGGSDAGSEAGGTVVLTKTVEPASTEKLNTPDGALELTILAGTFDGPTTVTISRLADRPIDNNLIVPAYAISATKEALLPFQLALTGNNAVSTPNTILAVERAQPDGTYVPTPMLGSSNPSGTITTWGLARNFGSFSLGFQPLNAGVFDLTSSSCLKECCQSPTPSGNIAAVGGSCFCSGLPALECLARTCQPGIAAAIERCVDIAATANINSPCRNSPSGPMCMTTQSCCLNGGTGQCVGQNGGTCPGMVVRCDLSTACPSGTKCCVFDDEAYCATTCPNERTWCNTAEQCDGGTCTPTPKCPHGTCGTPPAVCN